MWEKKNSTQKLTVLKDPHTAGSGSTAGAQTAGTNTLYDR